MIEFKEKHTLCCEAIAAANTGNIPDAFPERRGWQFLGVYDF
jgi:hypothetical protein